VDAGDLIGVHGSLRRTDKGELSVRLKRWEMLSRRCKPLPTNGMAWPMWKKRYRQRHLDLIVSPQTGRPFRRRAKLRSAASAAGR